MRINKDSRSFGKMRSGWPTIKQTRLVLFFCVCLFGVFGLLLCLYPDAFSCTVVPKNQEPLIFIGGHPRSGTTLMRVLLDVHPTVRCGPETHILPLFLRLYDSKIAPQLKTRLPSANITYQVVDSLYVDLIHSLLQRTGPEAERLCVKDPYNDVHMQYLLHLFPNSKFILMVRDGRAVVNSIMSRKVSISGLNISDPEGMIKAWNKHYQIVNSACEKSDRCTLIRYEQLVLRPRATLTALLKWLDIPWNEVVMQHEENVDEVYLSNKEKSTSQVVFPVYTDALGEWATSSSKLTRDFMHSAKALKMMKFFGYSNLSIPPNYGVPESEVEARAQKLHQNSEFRKLFKSLD